MEAARASHIPLQLTRGSIVASIQVDLSDETMTQFRQDLLSLVKASGATRIILDVSGVHVMDLAEFESLQRTVAMAGLLGARSVVAGLRPGVVSSLVELDAPVDWVVAALNLEQAFALFQEAIGQPATAAPPERQEEQTDEAETP